MRIFYGTYRYIYNRIPVVFFASKSTIQRTGIPILVLSTGRTPMKPTTTTTPKQTEVCGHIRERERDIFVCYKYKYLYRYIYIFCLFIANTVVYNHIIIFIYIYICSTKSNSSCHSIDVFRHWDCPYHNHYVQSYRTTVEGSYRNPSIHPSIQIEQ